MLYSAMLLIDLVLHRGESSQ